jgi:hypothetical protein
MSIKKWLHNRTLYRLQKSCWKILESLKEKKNKENADFACSLLRKLKLPENFNFLTWEWINSYNIPSVKVISISALLSEVFLEHIPRLILWVSITVMLWLSWLFIPFYEAKIWSVWLHKYSNPIRSTRASTKIEIKFRHI